MKINLKLKQKQEPISTGWRVRTSLQGGRDANACEACYRNYDDEYFETNKTLLKLGRHICCTDPKYCNYSGCLSDINQTADEYFN